MKKSLRQNNYYRFAPLLFFYIVFFHFNLEAQVHTSTQYVSEKSTYQTHGHVDIDIKPEIASKVGIEFEKYNNWALKDINGTPDNPNRFLILIQRLDFIENNNLGSFLFTYDVDLPWPLNSKNNSISFDLLSIEKSSSGLKKLTVGLTEKNSMINFFQLNIYIVPRDQYSRLIFNVELKLTSIIDVFFSLEAYKKNIEWRIVKVIENLKGYILEKDVTANPVSPEINQQSK